MRSKENKGRVLIQKEENDENYRLPRGRDHIIENIIIDLIKTKYEIHTLFL